MPMKIDLQAIMGTVNLVAGRLVDREQGGYPDAMTTPVCPSYAGHRFPAEVISHAVWLYFRFPLSLYRSR